MRLGVRPGIFLLRLLVLFFATYVLWKPVAPSYTYVLASLTRGFLHVTERLTDPDGPVTIMAVRETSEGRPAIFFAHRLFPGLQSGIPSEWVQANLVLLIPLMLATPAATIRQRLGRLGLALAIALALQILDLTVTVKALYASYPPAGYGGRARWLYELGDAFAQSMDTQLFPFAIWAGIHFKQILGRGQPQPLSSEAPPAARRKRASRAARAGR